MQTFAHLVPRDTQVRRLLALLAFTAWPLSMSSAPALVLSSGVHLQPAEAAPAIAPAIASEDDPQDRGWPRKFQADGHELLIYAPQVEEWPKFERVTFRAAISIGKPGEEATFGTLLISAKTDVAYEDRLVVLTERKFEKVTFPNVEPEEVARLEKLVIAAMPPEKAQTVSLDRLVAAMDPSKVDIRKVEVNLAPPKIFASDKPAVMVMFMGKPRFKPVPESDLLFAINTNWDIFLDPAAKKYYMRNEKSWLVTSDLEKGPWIATASLPASLSKLPNDENWSDVRAAIPGVPAAESPAVFVTNEPAELIVTSGEPELELIPGTALMFVANTESDLFYNTADKHYYLLAAGRWFKSVAVGGPWAATSASLPEDFKKIPEGSDSADVLASVPGTPAANEAMIMASIPQKATVNRNDLKLNVAYDGAPKFEPIESTTVQYAANTHSSVFLVSGKYYCCENAVWFEAPSPTGVWTVATSIPQAIYTIPPTSPKYNVTYVQIYESTPTTVVTGYTSGYSGETVAATGAVMFGLGVLIGVAIADDDCCWSYRYPACHFSYGCGAVWHGGHGGYVASSRYYGPYGGAGRAAAYNPSTGVYSRAGYAYGPSGAAGYRTAYNPSTGNAAGRAGGVSPYGSWGASAVTNGDKWATASHKTTARGTTATAQTSEGAKVATAQGRYGNGATVAKSADGDYYAAKDGNVYKNSGSGWEQTQNRPSNARGAAPTTTGTTARPTTSQPARPSTTNATTQPTTRNSAELQQQATARTRGEQNSARASQYQRGNTQRAAPSQRSGGSGGGGRGGRR
jgi:hypothetical protein